MKQLRWIPYLEHYIFWVFMFFFVFDYHFWEENWGEALLMTSIELSSYLAIAYLNYGLVIPRFLKVGRSLIYIFLSFALLVSYALFVEYSGLALLLYEGSWWRNFFSSALNFSLFWLLSYLYWYYQQLQQAREDSFVLRAEKLETEMKFLKNQISPHFIFNTLNNIYSLVQQQHEHAAPMLAKLSKILRYLLYDSALERVSLQKELDTIQEYIALQLLRKPRSENVDFYQEGSAASVQIAPLLLLNFVENCFKHSGLDTSENSISAQPLQSTVGGLGNSNIRRQLELSYPNRHQLKQERTATSFLTHLTIQL